MKSRSSCNRALPLRLTIRLGSVVFRTAALAACLLLQWLGVPRARANNDAPAWMHALVSAALPAHDEKTDAVQLYAQKIVTVQSADKIRTQVRVAYKILRPGGRDLGTVVIPF